MCRMYSSVVNFNAPLNTQFVRLIPFYLCLPAVGPYWLRFGAQTSQSAREKKHQSTFRCHHRSLFSFVFSYFKQKTDLEASNFMHFSQRLKMKKVHWKHKSWVMRVFCGHSSRIALSAIQSKSSTKSIVISNGLATCQSIRSLHLLLMLL